METSVNNKCRPFTTLEQSKKLAEILPLESADMCYEVGEDLDGYITKTIYTPLMHTPYNDNYIPCWSLASLLGVLPQSITKYIKSERCQKTFHLNLFHSYYHCVSYSSISSVSDDDTLYCIGRNNWVDACVAMIERLYELKLL